MEVEDAAETFDDVDFEYNENKSVTRRMIYRQGIAYEENFYECLGRDVPVSEAFIIKDRSTYAKQLKKKSRNANKSANIEKEHHLYYITEWQKNKQALKEQFNLPFVRKLGKRSYVCLCNTDTVVHIRKYAHVGEFNIPMTVGKDKDFKLIIVALPFLEKDHDQGDHNLHDGDHDHDELLEKEGDYTEQEENNLDKLDINIAKKFIDELIHLFVRLGIILPYTWDIGNTKNAAIIKFNTGIELNKTLMIFYILKQVVWKFPDNYHVAPNQNINAFFGKKRVNERMLLKNQ